MTNLNVTSTQSSTNFETEMNTTPQILGLILIPLLHSYKLFFVGLLY